MALDTILQTALERGASDVHISEWEHPETAILFRMEGRLVPFPIKEETMITVRETFCRWRREGQLDFARPILGTNARFRANLFMTCLGEAAALRILRGDIPTLDVLHVLVCSLATVCKGSSCSSSCPEEGKAGQRQRRSCCAPQRPSISSARTSSIRYAIHWRTAMTCRTWQTSFRG